MYNHTIIGQLLQMFPRLEFQKAVKETGCEYHARGFSSWNRFAVMLFGIILPKIQTIKGEMINRKLGKLSEYDFVKIRKNLENGLWASVIDKWNC